MKTKGFYHPELANGRWHRMTIAEQLGNVGSEYERALRWKQAGDHVGFEHAFARMLELLDLDCGSALEESSTQRADAIERGDMR